MQAQGPSASWPTTHQYFGRCCRKRDADIEQGVKVEKLQLRNTKVGRHSPVVSAWENSLETALATGLAVPRGIYYSIGHTDTLPFWCALQVTPATARQQRNGGFTDHNKSWLKPKQQQMQPAPESSSDEDVDAEDLSDDPEGADIESDDFEGVPRVRFWSLIIDTWRQRQHMFLATRA